ncbi:unnamed protein product [Linum trigynum]|uniref:Uncharacterized protein n=1 Tax=Linum trigynum TaxID=586398 RepID=A0AAV2G8X4_9ROSI
MEQAGGRKRDKSTKDDHLPVATKAKKRLKKRGESIGSVHPYASVVANWVLLLLLLPPLVLLQLSPPLVVLLKLSLLLVLLRLLQLLLLRL